MVSKISGFIFASALQFNSISYIVIDLSFGLKRFTSDCFRSTLMYNLVDIKRISLHDIISGV